MRYPKFLEKGGTSGFVAPSSLDRGIRIFDQFV